MRLPRPRFTVRRLMVAVVVAAVVCAAVLFAQRASRRAAAWRIHRRHALARLNLAKEANRIMFVYYEGRMNTCIEVHRSSIQLMESELDLSDGDASRIAAFRGHRDRMKRVEGQEAEEARLVGSDKGAGRELSLYYFEEAESWLARAEAER